MKSNSLLITPQLILFGHFRKDFALNGLRLGVLYAGSSELCSTGGSINFLQVPSTINQDTLAVLLSDHQWIESYVKLYSSRLTQRYEKIKKKFEDIDHRISKAEFYVLCDFPLLVNDVIFEEENRLFEMIFDHGVYRHSTIPSSV